MGMTKAELAAENKQLRRENKILREYLHDSDELIAHHRKILLVIGGAYDDTVNQLIDATNAKFEAYRDSRSQAGKHAVEEKQKQRWPEKKKAALKKEYLAKRESFPSDYAVCQHLARLILEDVKKWRQIETQLKKMELIK